GDQPLRQLRLPGSRGAAASGASAGPAAGYRPSRRGARGAPAPPRPRNHPQAGLRRGPAAGPGADRDQEGRHGGAADRDFRPEQAVERQPYRRRQQRRSDQGRVERRGRAMSFSEIFIRRPVLSTVVSFLILLLGAQGITSMSIRQYPKVDETVITITT